MSALLHDIASNPNVAVENASRVFPVVTIAYRAR
jgi:hypothetical protein